MTRSRFVICLECCYTHRAGNLELFARLRRPGRAPGTAPARDRVRGRVIALRRQGLSSYEISARLPAEGTPLNRTSVAEILTEEGFGRLLCGPAAQRPVKLHRRHPKADLRYRRVRAFSLTFAITQRDAIY